MFYLEHRSDLWWVVSTAGNSWHLKGVAFSFLQWWGILLQASLPLGEHSTVVCIACFIHCCLYAACPLPPAQAASVVSLSLCCGKQHGLRCGKRGSLNSKTALTLNLKVFVLIKSRHIQDNKCIYKYLLLYSLSFFLSFNFLLES